MIPAPLTPEFDDRSGHALAPLAVADAEGRPVLALVVQATFALFLTSPVAPRRSRCCSARSRSPASSEPGAPACAANRDCLVRPALISCNRHARLAAEPVTQLDAGLRVGATQKIVRVFGDAPGPTPAPACRSAVRSPSSACRSSGSAPSAASMPPMRSTAASAQSRRLRFRRTGQPARRTGSVCRTSKTRPRRCASPATVAAGRLRLHRPHWQPRGKGSPAPYDAPGGGELRLRLPADFSRPS